MKMATKNFSPEYIKCPVCIQVYPEKIFQCSMGHSVCHLCYEKCQESTKHCPVCRIKFGDGPIRNYALEGIMGELSLRKKVECPHFLCGQLMDSNLLEEHVSRCKHNFEKFGPLINICERTGYSGYKRCTFLAVNKCNVAEWIQHAQRRHGSEEQENQFPLKKLETLFDVQINTKRSRSPYPPIIYNFKRECFAIVTFVQAREELLLTPYLINYAAEPEKVPKCEVKFTFTTTHGDNGFGSKEVEMSASPASILDISDYRVGRFCCSIPIAVLKKEKIDNRDEVKFLVKVDVQK